MSAWADTKARARQAVHTAFRRAALYQAPNADDPVAVNVRWHPAGARIGELAGTAGLAELVTTSDRIIFDLTELATLGINPVRGAVVTITDESPQISLELDTQAERDGPVADVWMVTRA